MLIASSQDTRQSASFAAQQRIASAVLGVDDVMFRQPLWAQLAAIDGMIRIATRGDCLAIANAHQHSAADRAIAARGLDPAVGNLLRGDVAYGRVFGEGIFFARDIESEKTANLHAARFFLR